MRTAMKTRCLWFSRLFALATFVLWSGMAAADAVPPKAVSSPRSAVGEHKSQAIRVPLGTRVLKEEFFKVYAARFDLGPHDSFVAHKEGPSLIAGQTFAKYQQFYRGVPVVGAQYNISLRDGLVVSGLGRTVSGLSLDVRPQTTEVEALRAAKQAYARRHMRPLQDIQFTREPTVSLVIVSLDGSYSADSFKLVYQCVLVSQNPLGDDAINVDAMTGRVLTITSRILYSWQPTTATGQSYYDGLVTFDAEREDTTNIHRLRSKKVVTLDASAIGVNPDYSLAQEYTSNDGLFPFDKAAEGVSAHWGVQQSMKYFETHFKNNCLEGAESPPNIISYIDPNLRTPPAYFMPGDWYMVFGTSANLLIQKPYVWLNVVSHEFTHCILYSPLGWWPYDRTPGSEAAALSESFSDIFAEIIESEVKGSSDWISIGHKLDVPFPGRPDTYHGLAWVASDDLQHDPDHTNSSVHSLWFYLLSMGGTGTSSSGLNYEVDPIPFSETADRIIYTNFMEKLWSTATYPDARDGSIQTAIELCGDFSGERISTHDAWWAVGLFPEKFDAYPYISPFHQEMDVEPWPATLRWQAGEQELETAWDLRLSTTPVSLPVVWEESLVSQNTDSLSSGLKVGKKQIVLKPGTTYRWQVRRHTIDPKLSCWGDVWSFTTAAKKVVLTSPITSQEDAKNDKGKYHPWNLDFSWEALEGASSYTIQVASDPSFEESTLLFPEQTIAETEIELDVKIDTTLYWRVRPNYAIDDKVIEGSWAQESFVTTKPAVELVAPAYGEEVFPWPVHLEWKPVEGAGHFILELYINKAYDIDADGELQNFPLQLSPDTLTYDINVRGDEYEILYEWRVRVIGPQVEGLAKYAGFQEEGTPDEKTFAVLGSATEIKPVTPDENSCPAAGEPMDFEWKAVKNATKYIVNGQEAVCPDGSPCIRGPKLIPREVSPDREEIKHVTLDGRTGPVSNINTIGYFWDAQTFGPEDLPGYRTVFDPYLIQPPPPELLYPQDGTAIEEDTTLQVGWQTPMAPHGRFFLSVYKGDGNCQLEDLGLSTVIMSNAASGETAVVLDNLQVDEGHSRHSWRVRPSVYDWNDSAPCAKQQWSECRTFTVKKKPEEPPDDADSTSMCNETVHAGGNADEKHVINLGRTSGTFTLTYNHYGVPDRIVVTYEGQVLYDPGCEPGADSVQLNFSGSTDWITVEVYANCEGEPDTEWKFEVSCPH